MINNRQGGRRRGRGGQRQNSGGQPGNRQDNRQRGNAAQLLEKYKSMARDSQLAGDRVQTEYYLQYADHYFRVLGEAQRRFDEQRPRRGDEMDEDEQDENELDGADGGDDQQDDRPERAPAPRPERAQRSARPQRRPDRDDEDERPADRGHRANGQAETIPFDALPPAIGRDDEPDDSEQPADERKPRRRPRAARPSDDEDIAPAA